MDQMDIRVLKALREQHNLKPKSHDIQISKGNVVLIKGDEKNRGNGT